MASSYKSSRSPRKTSRRKNSRRSRSGSRSRSPKGLFKPVQIRGKLAEFMGRTSAPRTEITKKIWEHIRRHKLQEGRTIHADKKLEELIGAKSFSMLEIAKRIQKYIQ